MDKIEYLQTQIDKIKIELVMKDYNNGWLNTKSNGDSNILNS